MARTFLLLSLVCLAGSAAAAAEPAQPEGEAYFYRGYDYGSDASFNPVRSFVNWSFDTLQVPESFDDEDLGERLTEVWRNLRRPGDAIDEVGDFEDFVNRQILPIDFDNLDDSVEMIPNYALHLFGGGITYRANVEWFRAHGHRYARTQAAVLQMAAEVLQEAVEKKTTTADDEVADVFLFRPAGIVLFSFDKVARFVSEKLGGEQWAYQPIFDFDDASFSNAGENFVLRPGSGRHRAFLYFGLTNLAGASHARNERDRVSWGIGAATERAARDDFAARLAGGVFYDRNGSLLASVILNGTDQLALRVNVYPGVVAKGPWSPGLYVGVTDDGDPALGVSLQAYPFGIGSTAR